MTTITIILTRHTSSDIAYLNLGFLAVAHIQVNDKVLPLMEVVEIGNIESKTPSNINVAMTDI